MAGTPATPAECWMCKARSKPSNDPRADCPPGVYFLADAHLGAEPPGAEQEKEQDLLKLLRRLRGRADVLYLVGDLFDFWFEYPSVSPPHGHSNVLRALAELSAAGTAIRFTGGNHDYWAGPNLEAITGATVFRDAIEETHFGKRLFIAHGDGLPEGDLGYKFLKSILRNRLAIALFRLLHPTVGAALARWASSLSSVTDERIERVTPPMLDFIDRKLDSGYDAVVVAHVHRPTCVTREGRTGVIIGDWMRNRSIVLMDERGFSMLRWSGGELMPRAEAELPGEKELAAPEGAASS